MGKCKICGADIPDGQEICEKCQSDLDAVNEEGMAIEELEDFDFSNVELPELSGDLFETDLEFNLEDIGNNLENPDIPVHDFDLDKPQLSEEDNIKENVADIELPELSEDSISMPEETIAMESSDSAANIEKTEDMLDDIPDISDILSDTVQMESDMINTDLNTPEEEIDTKSEEGLLPEDIDNLLAEASGNQDEVDLFDLLPETSDETDHSENVDLEADTNFVDDLLGGLDLSDMMASGTESDDLSKDKKRDIFSELDDGLNIMDDLPDAEAIANVSMVERKPKLSIWKRLFGNLKDEKWEKQKEKEEKLEAEKLAKAEAEKAKEAEKESENGEEEQKLDPKEAKKAEKQAKKEEKARIKEEKKAEKQKMKELAELDDADEGRINRVGAAIVFVFFGIFAVFVIVGTNSFSYNSSISQAAAYFDEDKYNSAYDALWGLEIKEKDAELYSKVQMVMYLNKQWNSYENYTNIRMYPEALDSLLKGIQKYDSHIDDAKELEVSADYKKIRTEILKELKEVYGLTEKEAYKLLSVENQADYSKEVIQLANES
ncbi:MAG: hypothetical protein HFJ09_03215 [Lachnospiraceae bacterium]|nr:hypothetical protein [Lachnospiraceae bacterium]